MATDATGAEPAADARRPWGTDPVPEQHPWRTPEDAAGWQTVYRGKGQRRPVKNSVVLELSPERWAWLSRAGAARGLLLQELLEKLIDDARTAEERRAARAKKRVG